MIEGNCLNCFGSERVRGTVKVFKVNAISVTECVNYICFGSETKVMRTNGKE